MHFTQRIIEERKRQGITQRAIAEALNTTQQQVNKYEHQQQELPAYRFIQIAELLGVSLDYLAGRSERREISTENTAPPPEN